MNTGNSPQYLTRAECNVLRGLAIIGIFLHNYCHWLPGIVRENEYQFFQGNVDGMCGALLAFGMDLPVHLISFFGHYGVPIFLFLSAYGLEQKYGKAAAPAVGEGKSLVADGWRDAWAFVKKHFLKLFKMMIVGYAAFLLIDRITPGSHHYALADVVAQLFMVNNMLPNPDNIIWPGPYWYFGLMLQLYVIYRLLLYKKDWRWTMVLMVLCLALQLILGAESEVLNRYRYNFMGGMLPFGCGILYSRYVEGIMPRGVGSLGVSDQRSRNVLWLLLWTAVCFLLSLHYVSWTLVPVAVIGASIFLVKMLPSSWVNNPSAVLPFMGSISAALFVCHPITRKIIIPISRHGDVYAGLLIYVVTSVVMAWLWHSAKAKKQ